MRFFAGKRQLPLIDLVEYEATLKSIKETNDAGGMNLPYPLIPPGDSMSPQGYTVEELELIENNRAGMWMIWRKYSGLG